MTGRGANYPPQDTRKGTEMTTKWNVRRRVLVSKPPKEREFFALFSTFFAFSPFLSVSKSISLSISLSTCFYGALQRQ